MKSTAIVSVIAAATLGFSSLASAQDHDRGDRHGQRGQAHAQGAGQAQHQRGAQPQYQQRQVQQYQQRQLQPQYRQPQYRQPQFQQYRNPAWQQQRVYTPQPQWSGNRGQWADSGRHYRRGEVLPWQYRQRPYYVSDWRAYPGLYAPPYGYQWVQDDGGDFILVALATGLIANLLINGY